MNKFSTSFITLIIFLSLTANATSRNTSISPIIKRGNDSLNIDKLIQSFDGFIGHKDKPNSENQFIAKEFLLSTSALVDEIKELEKNTSLKDDNYYNCTLENIIKLQKEIYQIQFSYTGMSNDVVSVRGLFTMFAKFVGIVFSSTHLLILILKVGSEKT